MGLTLSNKNTINPEEFAKEIVEEDEYKKEIIEELITEKNLNEEISLDKQWIEKKTKTLTKKLDTGFVLKGKLEDFNDTTKYSVTKNDDGSINLILKNVRLIEN